MKLKYVILLCIIVSGFSVVLFNLIHQHDRFFCDENYSLISPDINCEKDPSRETKVLRVIVDDYINQTKTHGDVNEISVFYRNLSNRQWFGVNENENFSPGSLLKLPLAITYYKLA